MNDSAHADAAVGRIRRAPQEHTRETLALEDLRHPPRDSFPVRENQPLPAGTRYHGPSRNQDGLGRLARRTVGDNSHLLQPALLHHGAPLLAAQQRMIWPQMAIFEFPPALRQSEGNIEP